MKAIMDRLNESQRKVFLPLVRFCLGMDWKPKDFPLTDEITAVDNYMMLLLDGYAGTGKTYTINRLVEYLSEEDPSVTVAMTAPTNKAVRVLKKNSECKVPLTFCTLHSFLGLKEIINTVTGERTFGPDAYSGMAQTSSKVHILIVDETSQLQKELFKYLAVHVSRGLKVIFMGDDKQIPPVGEVQSIPFLPGMRTKHNIYLLSLTKIERQAEDNPIVGYAEAIRQQFTQAQVRFSFTGQNKGETGIEVLGKNIEELKPVLAKYFCSEQFKKDSDYIKVICWRNSTAKYFNDTIRKLIYKEQTLAKIMVEERLIATGPIFKMREGKWEVYYTTNEELEVKEVKLSTTTASYRAPNSYGVVVSKQETFKTYNLLVQSLYKDKADRQHINVIHESEELRYAKFIKDFAAAAKEQPDSALRGKMWNSFYDVQKLFAGVDYDYCLTAHKAQGSSYDYALVHEWDIDVSRDYTERNRIRYVAATRPRNKLFIVK